jgi:hypothetical protein
MLLRNTRILFDNNHQVADFVSDGAIEVVGVDAAALAGDASALAGLSLVLWAGGSELPESPDKFRFLSPSFLKSVSYHPDPDKRKDGAETKRLSCATPQWGHSSGSGSDKRINSSVRLPHAAH